MNIIVTGASRGIGYELVKILSIDPANKVVAIARNMKALLKLKNECSELNRSSSVFIIEADLSDLNSIPLLVKNILILQMMLPKKSIVTLSIAHLIIFIMEID